MKEPITNIGIPLQVFVAVSMIFCILTLFWVFWSSGISLLCIVGEFPGKGSLAVAVGVSDQGQVTGDTRHVTHDM